MTDPEEDQEPAEASEKIGKRRRKRRRTAPQAEKEERAFVYSRDTKPGMAKWRAKFDTHARQKQSNRIFLSCAIPVLIGLLVWGAYQLGKTRGMPAPSSLAPEAGETTGQAATAVITGPERAKALEKIKAALAARREGKLEEAFDFLREARDIDPRIPGIMLLQARISVARRDLAQADTLLTRSIRGGESQVESLNLKGTLLAGQKAFREAYAAFEEASALEPLDAYTYYYWGEAMRQEGRPAGAIEKLEMAEALATEQSDLFLVRAKLLLSRVEAEATDSAFADDLRKRTAGDGASGEVQLAGAALALKENANEEAARLLGLAEKNLQPLFYRYLVADPFFGFYRSRTAVKELLMPAPMPPGSNERPASPESTPQATPAT